MPTIAIVGAGRVGRTLGRRLRSLGWTVGAVVTRSKPTARAAMRAIGGGMAHAGLTRRVLASDVVLISTPDDAIPAVAAALAEIGGDEWRGHVILHTSGALDRTILAPLASCGAATGSLHPLQTFSGRGLPRLAGVIFAVEGDRRAAAMARTIARSLGGIAITVDGRNKPAYHAAGAFVAGHILAIAEGATQILMALGFTRRRAARALLPLARQVLENFERLGPRAAWTGPLSRGDYRTIVKHAAALQPFSPELREAYSVLSRLGARLLARNPDAALARLKNVFRKSSGGKS
jgi:predicted short-subunit dehydrogenase-like oxidoreductase (DUF2520 family)